MGVVYKALQLSLNRLVALKMILPGEHARPDRGRRFRTEAEAVARLRHPNVVQIYEVGEHEGRPFLALELVEGGNLSTSLAGTPLPGEAAAALTETLARAMHHAHTQGIVHRDLKPANVLLAPDSGVGGVGLAPASGGGWGDGRPPPEAGADRVPKITDFGLAKCLDEDLPSTQSGAVLGTPSYMAPEQAAGRTEEVGAAADIYALGAVLYECLTGRPPFKGATPLDTLVLVRFEEPVPVRRLQPKVSRDLETICLKCLQKEPWKRYASAEELADDLRRFRAKESIRARPSPPGERALKWARRNPPAAALAAVVVLLTALAVGLVTWQWRRAEERAVAEGAARQDAEHARRQADSHRRQAERLVINLSFEKALALCEQGDVGLGLLWLEHSLQSTPAEDGDFQRLLMANLDAWGRRAAPLRHLLPAPRAAQLALSPDGRTLAVGEPDGVVRLWDLESGRQRDTALTLPHAVSTLAFSPDGRLLAAGSAGRHIHLWDLESGIAAGPPLPSLSGCQTVWFSPDGTTLRTADRSPPNVTFRSWDRRSGRPLGPDVTVRAEMGQVAFHPDGRSALVWTRTDRVQWLDTDNGEPLGAPLNARAFAAVAVSPDGARFALGYDDGKVRLWDTATRKAIGPPLVHPSAIHQLRFSTDGEVLAALCHDHKVRLWSSAEQALKATLDVPGSVSGLGVGAGGGTLVLACPGGVHHWQPIRESPPALGPPHQGDITCMAVSPDGRTLLTGSSDHTARLWDLAARAPAGAPLAHDSPLTSVAWSPDGSTLLSIARGWDYRFWDSATGRRLGEPIHTNMFTARGVFSPDGKRALLVGPNGRVLLAEAATGQVVREFANPDMARGLFFDRSGTTAFTATWGPRRKSSWQRWDVASGEMVGLSAVSELVTPVSLLSPPGDILLTGGPNTGVQLWDTASGQPRRPPLRTDLRTGIAAFCPDGRTLLTAGSDRTVHYWDVESGEQLERGLPHPEPVSGVALSPDGHTVATTCGGSLRLWDFTTAKPTGPVHPVAAGPDTLLWSPDGKQLLVRTPAQGIALLPGPTARRVAPERLRLWVEVLTGRWLDNGGSDHWLDAEEWRLSRTRLEELGGAP
jgi:WD40 repeat protein